MTQPTFGATSFGNAQTATPRDAFELVTGEALQNARAAFPERSFLVDENVQAVADAVNAPGYTANYRESMSAPYVGKWIIVAFALGDHVSRFGMEIVNAQPPSAVDPKIPLRYGLTAIFDTEPWGEKLASFAVGEKLTVMGQIDQLNPFEIRLRFCELAGG